ncbi:MAG: hypothetical protein HYY05_05330 [Chloroflexi bacterium]|nr:hypothetical protein [Chloroflexota bacterium]
MMTTLPESAMDMMDEVDGETAEKVAAEPPPPPLLSIDLAWYERTQRSLAALLVSRLCGQAGAHAGDRRTDGSGEPLIEELLADIERCCSGRPGFVTPRTPVLEAVFRAILANGNRPLPMPEVRRRLMGWLALHEASPVISEERLVRLVESDNFYGIRADRP